MDCHRLKQQDGTIQTSSAYVGRSDQLEYSMTRPEQVRQQQTVKYHTLYSLTPYCPYYRYICRISKNKCEV